MATYTAVALGGNWNVAATWTGGTPGQFPTTGDTAILTTTSGPVTVTGTDAACLVLNMSGYGSTLTIANGRTLNVFGTGANITFGGTIATGTTGVVSTRNISITSGAITINFNGVIVPRLNLGYLAGAGTQTVTISGTNPTVENLVISNGNTNAGTSLAGITLNVSSSLNVSGSNGLSGIPFNFSGSACSVTTSATISSGFTVLDFCNLSLLTNLNIGGSGTFTFQPNALLTHNNFALSITSTLFCVLNTSAVTWYDVLDNSCRTNLTSDLNISRDLLLLNSGRTFSAASPRNVNIGRNFSVTSGVNGSTIIATNVTFNLNGTGSCVWDSVTGGGGGFNGAIFNINTSAYTIGSATRNGFAFAGCTINLVGLNTCTVFTGHIVTIVSGTTVTFNTNKTGTGGSQVIWENLTIETNAIVTLTNDTTFAKNVTTSGISGTATINGSKLLVGGNLTSASQTIQGTSTIEFTGSSNATWAAGSYQNTIIVNKTVPATVTTATGNINWGAPNRIFTMNSAVNFTTFQTSFTLSNTPLTINNTSGFLNSFFNLNIPSLTLNINGATMQVAGTLLCTGGVTFAGAYGWTTLNFSCTVAGAIIRLQNITQFSSAEYTVNGLLNLVGTLGNRLILDSSGRANFTGSIATATAPTGSTMTLSAPPSTGTIVNGMTVSQATGQIPPGLAPFINDRPTIASGGSLVWVLNKTLTTRVPTPTGTIALAAGFKAKFTLANNGTSSQNVIYVGTQDIDSSAGKPIFVTGSNGDDAATDQALFRTLNWGPLVVQSGSVYYTFIN